MFNENHGTPTAFLTNFTKMVKLTKTPIACHYWEMKQLFMWLLQKKSWKLLESGFPDRYFGKSIAQVHMYCIVMHEICMASYPQLASLATYEFDSAIFRLNLGNTMLFSFPSMAYPNSDFFFFFFFARVADEFFEVARNARDTRILHWRDHWWIWLNK